MVFIKSYMIMKSQHLFYQRRNIQEYSIIILETQVIIYFSKLLEGKSFLLLHLLQVQLIVVDDLKRLLTRQRFVFKRFHI